MLCVYWFYPIPTGAWTLCSSAWSWCSPRPSSIWGTAPGTRTGWGRLYPRIPLLGVPGNCDYGSADQPERLTELGGVRILMMHGHTRHVKSGPMAAMYAARECGADILLFGHTHQPLVDRSGDFWVMNPGCIGPSPRRTYGVITLEDGRVDCAALRL